MSALSLGSVLFGEWGNTGRSDVVNIVDSALSVGINVIDTADAYSQGEAEALIGHAIKSRRDEIILATKVNAPMVHRRGSGGNSRRWILRAIDDSLNRLQTDRIDLYQLHRPDPDTPLDETLGTLDELVRAGKILHYGTSTFPASAIMQCLWLAERHQLRRLSTEQPPYSILVRGVEREVLPLCADQGIGVLSWGPLAGGWLSGSFSKRSSPTQQRLIPERYDLKIPANARKLELLLDLEALAAAAGMPLSHLALAFVLTHPCIASAIIGPRTPDDVLALAAAATNHLDADVLDAIDLIVEPGTNVNPTDGGWVPPGMASHRRRRGLGDAREP